MFCVKNMLSDDLDFAVRITDEMNWDLAKEDFEFMMEIEPKGCFVLHHNSKRIGIATAVCFGRVGWIGNVIVDKNCREKGAGSLLVNHAIEYLVGMETEIIGLYAYIDKISFYERLGFKGDLEFVVLEGLGLSSKANFNVRKVQRQNIQQIIDFDSHCLGFSRKKLLEPIFLNSSNAIYASIENGRVLGYAASKAFEATAELGPLVCGKGQNSAAVDLIRAVLNDLEGFNVSICLPRKETIILRLLIENGFKEKFCVARMFYGSPITIDCIYAAESLERG